METLLGRYKNLIVLAAILFAQIVGLALQVKRPGQDGETRLIRFWAVAAITPFEKAVVHTQQWVHDSWNGYINLHNVRKENQRLKDQIERMKLDEVRLAEDAKMARRVQALLQFKEQYIGATVAAQVIGSSGSEQSRLIYIDKGLHDGVKPDMAVITPTGIVGKIVQVFPDSAQVLPINDQLSGVGAALKDSRLQGILKGAPNGATTLQYVMSDEKVEIGEEVITSGGDRIFPKGLPVGKVVAVEPGKDLFLNIRVVPASHLDRLEEVLVVSKIVDKEPDTKDMGPIRASDILAERLPGVPSKPDADAAGNAIAGAAGNSATGAGAPGAKPSATGTVTKPTTGASNAVTKPTTGASATPTKPPSGASTTANRPSTPGGTVAAPRTAAGTQARTSPGAATDSNGSAGTARGTTANGAGTTTRSTTTVAKPLNNTTITPSGVKKVIVEPDPEPAKPKAKPAPSNDANPPATKPEGTNPPQ
jgi:rod shape-determining protein MreC